MSGKYEFARKRWFLWLFPLLLILLVYTLLVKPRRFFQCLPAPVHYLVRDDPQKQQAPLPAPVGGNRVQLLVNGNEALPVFLDQIANARETLRWQVMLFHPDETGRELAEALASASRRGVQVQVSFNIDQTVNGTIADGFSKEQKQHNQQAMQSILNLWKESGVEVRDNPAQTDLPLDGVGDPARSIQQSIQQNICISINHYDHRKLFIVDDRLSITGGMNVGKHYLYHLPPDPSADMVDEATLRQASGQPEAWEKWFDAGVVVEGPVVAQFVGEFNWRWEVLGGSPLPARSVEPLPEDIPMQFLSQRPGHPQIGARFFELVEAAREEIWVASPFVSYDPALAAFQAAARRGVRVVFVFPNERNEMALSRRVFLESAGEMVEAGTELYFNDLRMAHTKLLVVDGRQVLMGSFNLNHRSFRHDLETAVLIEDEAFAGQVIERVFQPYLSISKPVREPARVPFNPLNWLLKPFS